MKSIALMLTFLLILTSCQSSSGGESPLVTGTTSDSGTQPNTTSTPANTATNTPTNTATYTPTVTPTRTPIVPKAHPEQLPLPRQDFANETHLFYGRPMLEGNNYPVSHYRYGMTWDGLLAPHLGVDLANDKGSMVVAIGNGTVVYSGNDDTELFGFRNEFIS